MSYQPYFTTIPQTTDKTIIFPLMRPVLRFNNSHYNPDMTQHKLKMSELIAFLSNIEDQIRHNHAYLPSLFGCAFLYIFSSLVFILCIPKIPDRSDDSESSDNMLPVVISMVLLMTFLFWGCFVGCFIRRRNKLRAMKKEIQEYVEKNSESFNQRGLRWVIPDKFPMWIELWKDYSPVKEPQEEGLEEVKDREEAKEKKLIYEEISVEIDDESNAQSPIVSGLYRTPKDFIQSQKIIPKKRTTYYRTSTSFVRESQLHKQPTIVG